MDNIVEPECDKLLITTRFGIVWFLARRAMKNLELKSMVDDHDIALFERDSINTYRLIFLAV